MRGQGGDVVVGLLGPGIEDVLRLQGCEPVGLIAGQQGFHVLMAFYVELNRNRPIRVGGFHLGKSRQGFKPRLPC